MAKSWLENYNRALCCTSADVEFHIRHGGFENLICLILWVQPVGEGFLWQDDGHPAVNVDNTTYICAEGNTNQSLLRWVGELKKLFFRDDYYWKTGVILSRV